MPTSRSPINDRVAVDLEEVTLLIDAEDVQANLNGGAGFDIAVVTGAAGVTLDLGPANLEAAIGGTGNDVLSNSGYGRVILAGGAGNDVLKGGRGDDVLEGGAGNDQLSDLADGSDTYLFSRGDGQDTIEDKSFSGADKLVLQNIASGECTFSRKELDLTLVFGQGDQVTVRTITDSQGGSDSYIFARGDGQDTIIDSGMNSADDRISLTDIRSTEATLSRAGQDLLIAIGATDRITVRNHFDFLGTGKIEHLQFADGVEWGSAKLDAAAPAAGASPVLVPAVTPVVPLISIAPIKPVASITPIAPIATIAPVVPVVPVVLAPIVTPPILPAISLPSVPSLVGAGSSVQSGTDYVLGAAEQNLTLTGTAAINGTGNGLANTLSGNAGNNTLTGGTGSDTYLAYRGMGQDRIVENDATAGNTDTVSFASGVANNQLWFSHTGNDLAISIMGTADKMTVQNWYLGNQYHVEQIKTGDSKVLLDTQVEALVQAMAGFVPPAMGQTALTAAQQTALAPVLAANWH